ncbi:MAG TPA: hypothetical protein DIT89_06585, partial [Planctomycetaceae bacterium]|nr:hypothetical protein [Planctomycetaceae bacterium]
MEDSGPHWIKTAVSGRPVRTSFDVGGWCFLLSRHSAGQGVDVGIKDALRVTDDHLSDDRFTEMALADQRLHAGTRHREHDDVMQALFHA